MTPRLLGQRHSLCASREAKAVLDWDRQQYPVVGSGAIAQAVGHCKRTAEPTFITISAVLMSILNH